MGLFSRLKMAGQIALGGESPFADLMEKQRGAKHRTVPELLAAYAELPWLHAVTNKVSMATASVPWQAYRSTSRSSEERSYKARRARRRIERAVMKHGPEGRTKEMWRLKAEGEIEEIEEHPLLDCLEVGNGFMPGITVRQLTQAYLDVVGESFMLIERNQLGEPMELLPIPRTWVQKIATPDDPTFDIEFEGFKGSPPASEIVYFQMPDLRNPYGRGIGTAGALHDELATDEFAAKHTMKWFANGARPDVLIYGKGLDKAETARLEARWAHKFRGLKNAFKPAFLSADISVKELNQSFQSMQLHELRQFERDTIIQVYGVPPEILGVIENSNRATIEAADYIFGKWVVLPRMEIQTATLMDQLVPQFGDDALILGYESPVAEDKAHQLSVMQAFPYSFKVDDHREAAGSAPLEGDQGQVHMMPFNLIPQSSPALAPDLPSEPPPDDPDPDEPEDEPGTPDTEEDPGDEEPEEEAASILPGSYRVNGRLGTLPLSASASAFGEAGATLLKDDGDESALTEEAIALIVAALGGGAMLEAFTPILRDAVEDFGQGALAQVQPDGPDFEVNPRVIHYLETQGAEKIRGITDTTREALRGTLIEGVRNGEGIPELKARVEGVFEQARGRRATTIARTEVVGASNFGTWEGYKQGGVPGKEWLSSKDDDTRDSHEELDGAQVGIDADFTNSDGSGPAPGQMSGGAKNNAACRCTILAVLDFGQSEAGVKLDEETRAAMWRALDRERAPFERRVKLAVRKEFTDQQRQIDALIDDYGKAA